MTHHAPNLSNSRFSAITLAFAAAFALSPAFAQNAPTAASTPPQGTPMNEGRPSSDPIGTPLPNTDAPTAATASAATSVLKPATFKDLDANKDGKLSKDEVSGDSMWSSDFEVADVDKDGFVSKSEFRKHESSMKKTASNDRK